MASLDNYNTRAEAKTKLFEKGEMAGRLKRGAWREGADLLEISLDSICSVSRNHKSLFVRVLILFSLTLFLQLYFSSIFLSRANISLTRNPRLDDLCRPRIIFPGLDFLRGTERMNKTELPNSFVFFHAIFNHEFHIYPYVIRTASNTFCFCAHRIPLIIYYVYESPTQTHAYVFIPQLLYPNPYSTFIIHTRAYSSYHEG